jgi:hypothetical protein
MGAQMQDMNNQMKPPSETSDRPTTMPQYPTIGSNPTSNYSASQSSMPNLPMGKGNTTNSATSGQPQMGMPQDMPSMGMPQDMLSMGMPAGRPMGMGQMGNNGLGG